MKLINILQLILVILLFATYTKARKHNLRLYDDSRKYFSVSTFGFFKGGRLDVYVNKLSFSSRSSNLFGLTLTRTISDNTVPYMESHVDKCMLHDDSLGGDENIDIMSFSLDFLNQKVHVNCSKLFNTIPVQYIPSLKNDSIFETTRSRRSSSHITSDTFLLVRRKRMLTPPTPEMTVQETKITTSGKDTESKTTDSSEKTNKDDLENKQDMEEKETPKEERHNCSAVTIPLTKNQNGNLYSFQFRVLIAEEKYEGLYSLYFHNCANYDKPESSTSVNLSISITEQNAYSYLSAGEIPLPQLYFIISVVFFITGCIWIYVLRRRKDEAFKIHYLMGVLIFIKSLSLHFHGINYHIIAKDGFPMEAWAVLYYITHLLKGALLFITIVLIGTGWAFIKHILSDKDKKIFMIVIPLQVLDNVAKIIMEESEEGDSKHSAWREVFILVDLLCCGAILFPVVWSIRHLQEASQTDGKAAINLEKLKLFRHFYVMIVCYIYFTRIIVYLLQITVPFQYEWLDEFFKETATLIFFILTGYNFRPTSSNPYFRVPQDEDELVMEEVITQTGLTEGVTKTLRSRDTGNDESSTTTKRESSHEYD